MACLILFLPPLFSLFIFIFEITPVVSIGLQKTVEDRIAIYKTAILNAKEAGENAKVRRYERGLKVCRIIDQSAAFFLGRNCSNKPGGPQNMLRREHHVDANHILLKFCTD